MYSISLKLSDQTITSKGESVYEALKALEKPVKLVTKGVLEVTDGERRAVVNLPLPRIKRMFYPMMQKIHAKQLEFLMK